MITHSKIIVTVIENHNDSSVEWTVSIGQDGLNSVERKLFVDGEHQKTETNPSGMPNEVKMEIRRSVNRVARVQGKINKL